MWFIRLLILSLFFVSSISLAKKQSFYFEPNLSKLSGTIALVTFPGSPNYSSIKDGDEAETGAYLVLDEPIDVKLVPKIQIGNDESESNVTIIQLVPRNDSDWKKLENGSYVHITGTLFHAVWAHHHARVLLHAKEIQVTSKKKNVSYKLLHWS